MSDLMIIGYGDHEKAKAAYERVLAAQDDFIVQLRGLAVVTVDDDGKKHVDTPGKIVGVSAAGGALWGALIGLLFLTPGLGLLVGGLFGALSGKLSKSGVDDAFRRRVESLLVPGKAAVVIMASKVTEDKFAAALAPFGGEVLKTSLSEDDEAELAAELKGS